MHSKSSLSDSSFFKMTTDIAGYNLDTIEKNENLLTDEQINLINRDW